MRGLALDNRVDNGPGGTCLGRQRGAAPERSPAEPAPVPVVRGAMCLCGREISAPAADATGGVLCRPPRAPKPHYMTNRGVGRPPP
jgi:hypothetical protein